MPMSTEGTPAVSAYTATEQHMRMNYIDEERRRNSYHSEKWFQSDEELGEEFDSGMRRIREDAARTVTYTGLKPGVTYYAEVNASGEMVVLPPRLVSRNEVQAIIDKRAGDPGISAEIALAHILALFEDKP